MAINTAVYGDKTQWGIIGTSYPQGDDKNFYTVFFGNNGTLSDGVANNKIALNTPIDKSLSWCGVGEFSTLSNVEYYNQKQGDNFQMMNKDSRDVTNFAFLQQGGNLSYFYYANTSTSRYGDRFRWSPEAIDGDTSSTSNYNKNIVPLAQIPIKNCVLVPVLRVRSNVTDTSSANMAQGIYMWEYMDTNNTVNYTTHPYILNVGFELWGKNTDNDTNRTKRVSGGSYNTGIAILDELTYAKNQPFDVSAPIRLQDTSYSYCCTSKIYSASINGIFDIFGLVGNNNQSLPIPTSNTIPRQVGCGVVLPHPNGIMSDVVSNARLYYVEYYNGFQEWVRKQIACFGLFFTDDEQTAKTGDFDAETMFLGTLVNNIGNGDYTHGSDNRNQPQWNWNNTNDSEYSPDKPVPSEDSGNTSYLGAVKQSLGNGNWYVIPQEDIADVQALLANINDIPQDVGEDYFFGQNAIDCVLEIKYIFVGDYTFGKIMPSGKTGIKVGKYTLTTPTAYKFSLTAPETFTSNTIYIESKNFRSFQPYTSATFVVPFCGSIEIPISSILDRYCYMEETIDPLSGDIMARLFVASQQGSIEIASIQGNCALDAPVSGYQIAQYYQTRMQLISAQRNAMFNAAASLIGGSSGGAIAANYGNSLGMISQFLGGGINAAAGLYNAGFAHIERQHTLPPAVEIQKYTPNVEWGKVINPCIIVISSVPHENYNDSNYAAKTGFATYKVDTIGNQSGRVVCSNVALDGINCTPEEKVMIRQALESGVYIK